MSVKRSLQLENKENTPLKLPALERTFSPHTGTRLMSPGPGTEGKHQTRRETTSSHKIQSSQQKQLEALRNDLKKSVKSILKARQDLESLLPLEGSSELNKLFPRERVSTGDLLTELEKHRKLVDKVESDFAMGTLDGQCRVTGRLPAGNSYKFLKELLK